MGNNNYKPRNASTTGRGKEDAKSDYSGKKYQKKKPYPKKTSSRPSSYSEEPGSNDPAWYSANQSLLRDSASIPYSWAIGTPVDMANPLNAASTKRKLVVPGLQTMYLTPSIGMSLDPSSPINTAANSTYAFIRHANSGHANYDAPDLMLYITAMSQVYSYIVFLQRAYGAATLYAQKNRYMPDALLQAMYIDPRVRTELADFRYGINVLIQKAASFAVPNNMSLFNRQAFLYGNIYCEGDSIKDQLYMFSPDTFWKFQWNSTSSTGELVNSQFYGSLPSGQLFNSYGLLQYGNSLIDPLIMDEDMNIMSGDVLKAYGSTGIIKLAPLATEYPILPLRNQEVLEQMKNATVVGNFPGCVQTKIEQDPTKGWLVSKPTVTAVADGTVPNWVNDAARQAMSVLLGNRLITTAVADVTPEVTIENTRLMSQGIAKTIDGTNASVTLYTGSEVCSFCTHSYFVCTTDASGQDVISGNYGITKYASVVALMDNAADSYNYNLKQYFIAANFKFHPACYASSFKQDGTTDKATYVESNMFFDVDNYAILNGQDLQRMHEAALMNELNVPMIAKIGN